MIWTGSFILRYANHHKLIKASVSTCFFIVYTVFVRTRLKGFGCERFRPIDVMDY